MKRGLILEGGGLRCLFTAGVLDVLMENNIPIDTAIGVSAGAAFGCNIKSEQIGRVLRYNLKFSKNPRYFGIKSLLKTGNLFEEEFCYDEIPNNLDLFDYETYKNNPINFYAVATDIETGRAEYHLCETGDKNDLKWLQASASMPFVSRPVKINGHKYLDGGIADPIPVEFAQSLDLDKMLIIRPHPEGYFKEPQKGRSLIKLFYKDNPEFTKTMSNHYLTYNNEIQKIEELKREGKVKVIAPKKSVPAGVVERDPKNIQDAYNMGRQIALENLEEIQTFFKLENLNQLNLKKVS